MIGIRGGRLVDPLSKTEKQADLLIENGKIAAVGEPLDESRCEQIVDAQGLVVAPGVVDVHVHFGIRVLLIKKTFSREPPPLRPEALRR